ncbi:MAG: class II aldolase/adducin family protein [Nevskiaceae bacterium]|nr:MAG: class II aldolase/adducin family protein [Nevskiaceae bacterium]TBR73255.1 MAG: class II aldolase/adducin family protein [Nevskiaceae bacterium]
MAESGRLDIPSVRDQVSPEEWQARVDLAAAYRLVAYYRWDDLVFTHISARVPGHHDQFLINPYGLMFDEITASSLVKIDVHANKLMPSPFPVNPAGFTIHSAVHAVREDAGCVLHVHELNGVAVSAQKDGLLPLSQHSMFPLASIAYHDYEGIALLEGEKPRLQKDLGEANCLILRNHGLLTVGRTVADAFLSMYMLAAACRIQIMAQAGGGKLHRIPGDILAQTRTACEQVTLGKGPGALVWPGLLRRLDRMDPSYRS